MSPNLVCCVKRLANMAMKSSNDVEISCLAMAAISMSTNAIEAFLLEYSRFTKPYTYTNSFRNKSNISRKYKKLIGSDLKKDFPDVHELIQYRHDIVHHEPHSNRALTLGKVTTIDGAVKAAEITEQFVASILGCKNAKLNEKWTFVNLSGLTEQEIKIVDESDLNGRS